MQMTRTLELLANCVLRHANTACLHVKLELQSLAESKELVNMRQLLDGCLEVYKTDLRARGDFPFLDDERREVPSQRRERKQLLRRGGLFSGVCSYRSRRQLRLCLFLSDGCFNRQNSRSLGAAKDF